MTTTEEARNKETLRRFDAAVNTRDLDLISRTIDELFEPDVVIGTPLPIDATGADAVKHVWSMLLTAFPDIEVTVEDVIAEGDRVVARNTVSGTNGGEYMGRPPTGRSVTYNEVFICRFVDGRVAQTWGVVDVLSQMRQLGVVQA